MPADRHLLFRLARELRYRELPELIGRRLRLESLAQAREALVAVARPYGATAWTPHDRTELALLKYGLINAELDVPRAMLDGAALVGIDVLRATELIPPLAERRTLAAHDVDLDLLDGLAGDLDRPTAYLKLMLESPPPPGDLPRDFVLADACVTNCGAAWLMKHFYL